MRIRFLAAAALILLALAQAAVAQTFLPFTVRDIRVEGLQRTEPGTVFSYLPVKVGELMTEEKAQQALRALFATGFFRDVRLEVENDVLVVLVEERPSIAQLDFSGFKEFDNEVLRRVLRGLGLAEGLTFDRSLLDTAEQEIKRQYLSRGRYAAQVQSTVTPLERNRVGINFTVAEGEVAKIRSINIVGAQAFSEKSLLELFTLRTPGWITWYTKHDQYSRQKLTADIETLRSHYQNRGYLDFNVDSTQVSITPDRRDIYIRINISEGEKYSVSDVQLGGQMLVPKPELEKLVKIRAGEVFSRERLVESIKAIADRLGNEGYAFANANAVPQVDKEKRTVAFTILIDPGRRVYVRRINVAGNTQTRDEVVRREMRQLEGAYYDASKIQLSKSRIDRTQYFKDVNVETVPVAQNPDQVDLSFTVEEKPTGAFMLGAGLSSVDRFVVSGSLSQSNAFGSGKSVSAQVNSGKVNAIYSLSYLDPYFTIDGISQGFDAYHRKTDASSLAIGSYSTNTLGGGIKLGYPLSEKDSINFGLNADKVKLRTNSSSPVSYINFVNQFGNNYSYAAATVGWAGDTRDSALITTRGYTARAGLELAGGDLQFYRGSLAAQRFYPLTRSVTFALGGEFGYANGLGNKPVPFFKNFYAGGPGSVRGYKPLSLGPQDAAGNALGGTRKLSGGAEVLFPVPGTGLDRTMGLAGFLDAGQTYGRTENFSISDLRYAMGLALNWNSAIGSIKISIAEPLNDKTGFDRVQRLQLTVGSTF